MISELLIFTLISDEHKCERLIGVHASSIVYEVIRTILSLIIFFYEKILSVKEASKCKTNDSPPVLEVFVRAKNCCLCCFLFA